MTRRIEQSVMRGQRPDSLRTVELGLDVDDLTIPATPIPVRVWVRFGDVPVEVDAVVLRYTSRVAGVELTAPDGATHRIWVWTGAARPRPVE